MPKLFPVRALVGFALAVASAAAVSQIPQPPGRVVLVLPFENRSGDASVSWIGDSFPDTLDARLNSSGFLTISRDDRAYALDHLGLPVGFRPSRATSIRIAQQLDADFIIVGSYTVHPAAASNPGVAQSTGAAGEAISIQARVLDVRNLHLSSTVEDGAPLPQLYDAENAVAWKVARTIDPQLNVAESTFVSASSRIPLAAFENYIRGVNAPNATEALQRLNTAVGEAPGYPAALLALGKHQYEAHDYAGAARTLARVPAADRLSLEANFYLGLADFNSANYAGAEQAFGRVATRLPLPEVLNNQGVAAARQHKNGTPYFVQAVTNDPNEEDYHYNLAVAYYRAGNARQALSEAQTALKLRPGDPEAKELEARARLGSNGQPAAPGAADSGFVPTERIRRNYSEAGFRQAAFQIDQMRTARMEMLPPNQQASEYIALGEQYLNQGLIPEAEREFGHALKAQPDSAAAHAGLASVREQSGNPAEARQEADASNRLAPNAAAWLVLARLDESQNKLAASADDVNHALSIEPKNAAAIAMRLSISQRQSAASSANTPH